MMIYGKPAMLSIFIPGPFTALLIMSFPRFIFIIMYVLPYFIRKDNIVVSRYLLHGLELNDFLLMFVLG